MEQCKACNGTGQQTGTDGIIRKCPLCERTVAVQIDEIGSGIATIIFLLIIVSLFEVSLWLGLSIVFLILCGIGYLVWISVGYTCSNCHYTKNKKNDKNCRKCGIKFSNR